MSERYRPSPEDILSGFLSGANERFDEFAECLAASVPEFPNRQAILQHIDAIRKLMPPVPDRAQKATKSRHT